MVLEGSDYQTSAACSAGGYQLKPAFDATSIAYRDLGPNCQMLSCIVGDVQLAPLFEEDEECME